MEPDQELFTEESSGELVNKLFTILHSKAFVNLAKKGEQIVSHRNANQL